MTYMRKFRAAKDTVTLIASLPFDNRSHCLVFLGLRDLFVFQMTPDEMEHYGFGGWQKEIKSMQNLLEGKDSGWSRSSIQSPTHASIDAGAICRSVFFLSLSRLMKTIAT